MWPGWVNEICRQVGRNHNSTSSEPQPLQGRPGTARVGRRIAGSDWLQRLKHTRPATRPESPSPTHFHSTFLCPHSTLSFVAVSSSLPHKRALPVACEWNQGPQIQGAPHSRHSCGLRNKTSAPTDVLPVPVQCLRLSPVPPSHARLHSLPPAFDVSRRHRPTAKRLLLAYRLPCHLFT